MNAAHSPACAVIFVVCSFLTGDEALVRKLHRVITFVFRNYSHFKQEGQYSARTMGDVSIDIALF